MSWFSPLKKVKPATVPEMKTETLPCVGCGGIQYFRSKQFPDTCWCTGCGAMYMLEFVKSPRIQKVEVLP